MQGKTMEELRHELRHREFMAKHGTVPEQRILAPGEGFGFRDVERELIDPAGLGKRYAAWANRRQGPIADFVLDFEHRVLPLVTSGDVHDALQRSGHALGTLEKTRDTERFISMANPPWAMTYLFHACMERHTRGVPTWDRFIGYVRETEPGKWWAPVRAQARRRGVGVQRAERAMLWRLATAWQSAMRTVLAIATLRHEHHVPVKHHLFAHTVLKVDGWHGDRAFRLVMPSEYEDRKASAHTIFAGAPIAILDVPVSASGRRGDVWLPGAVSLRTLARDLTAGTDAAGAQISLFG